MKLELLSKYVNKAGIRRGEGTEQIHKNLEKQKKNGEKHCQQKQKIMYWHLSYVAFLLPHTHTHTHKVKYMYVYNKRGILIYFFL